MNRYKAQQMVDRYARQIADALERDNEVTVGNINSIGDAAIVRAAVRQAREKRGVAVMQFFVGDKIIVEVE